MKNDCQWIETKLEGFFCEQLNAEENGLVLQHLESCRACRENVDALRSVDPLIKQLFQNELAIARAPRRLRWPALVGATAAAFASVIVVLVLRVPQPPAPVTMLSQAPPPAVVATSQSEVTSIPKTVDPAAQDRAKPQPASPDDIVNSAVPAASDSKASDKNLPVSEFVVTDPAGYSRTLRDYRGHILIFGVWNGKQPQTVATLQKIYEVFGPNAKLRILGVAKQRQKKPASATFPVAYNQGSALLGAKDAEFLVLDGEGNVRERGSLLQAPSAAVEKIRSILSKIN